MKTLMKLMLAVLAALAIPGLVGEALAGHDHRHDHRHERRERREDKSRERIAAAAIESPEIREVAGRVSATLDRAKDDARRQLVEDVREWLAPRVATSWTPPARLVDAMIRQIRVTPEEKDYGAVYTAVIDVDFGSDHRALLIDAYRRDVARERMVKLGGALGFVLVCLAAVSGYIRADEATRGYHTTLLRLIAATAVGASGLALYRFLA